MSGQHTSRYCLWLPDRVREAISRISDRVGVTPAEFSRRVFDHSLREEVLNVMFPQLSGTLDVRD